MAASNRVFVIDEKDNVATVVTDIIEAGTEVEVEVGDEVKKVTLNDDIEYGHKFALVDIDQGETVYKYGLSIGQASTDIEQGTWVHAHNMEPVRARGDLA